MFEKWLKSLNFTVLKNKNSTLGLLFNFVKIYSLDKHRKCKKMRLLKRLFETPYIFSFLQFQIHICIMD